MFLKHQKHIRLISEGHWRLESNDAENSDLSYIQMENSYFKLIVLIFHYYYCFTVFLSNKRSLGEHKRLLSKLF